ncbi:uncharacterized protein [Fopius arisanus]|uniref:Uncharacterized protein isoform X2 n=1 Tax=Fopius arisanus TaxID=64838 RepID=A0A9R1T2W7_9HYME|nr:PREDICTED: uncharacterized protein LOC105265998 isoform X2 [Fopius arisanus]
MYKHDDSLEIINGDVSQDYKNEWMVQSLKERHILLLPKLCQKKDRKFLILKQIAHHHFFMDPKRL